MSRDPQRVSEFLRLLGPSGEATLRQEIVSTRPAEVQTFVALPGETAEVTLARVQSEGRIINALVWDRLPLKDAIRREKWEIERWMDTVDRADFNVRFEHHVAMRAVLESANALSCAGESLKSDDEGYRLKAAKILIESAGDHERFRSKVTAALSRQNRGGELPESDQALLIEVLHEAARVHRESVEAVEAKRAELREPPMDSVSPQTASRPTAQPQGE